MKRTLSFGALGVRLWLGPACCSGADQPGKIYHLATIGLECADWRTAKSEKSW